jgi:hypothetical protein
VKMASSRDHGDAVDAAARAPPRRARVSRRYRSTQAAQQAQSQQELNPHFVMDDLAAKTYAIATHLLNYVDHLELESGTARQATFKSYFNLRFVGVWVRCSSLYVEECIARRSCPSDNLTHWSMSTQVLQGRHRRPAGDAGHRGVDHAQRHFER